MSKVLRVGYKDLFEIDSVINTCMYLPLIVYTV